MALRLTQERFAEHLGVAPRTVRDWEADRPIGLASQEILDAALTRASDEQRARFAVLLDETREEDKAERRDVLRLGAAAVSARLLSGDWTADSSTSLLDLVTADETVEITPELATRLAHEWLVTDPPQLVETRAGQRIGEELIAKVERRVEHLRRMDDFIGGGDLHAAVEAELRATIELLGEAAYSEHLGRRLLAAVAELCRLAGWVAADAGLVGAATRYYSGGIRVAHAAEATPLAANMISLLSYLYANEASPHEAVLLAHTAYTGVRRRASATTKALLQERVAWAHARAGELRQTEKALGTVERLYEQRRPEDDPAWVYWLDVDEIEVMAGRCYTELRRPERAAPLLRAALESYDPEHLRETALYASWLAESYVQAGEIDEAAAQASHALTLAAQVNSSRGRERVRALRRALEPNRDARVVQDFEELYREIAVGW